VRDLENQRKFEEAIKEREMWKARALALEELLMGLPVDISLFESLLKQKVPT
jgi:hypothetical protein